MPNLMSITKLPAAGDTCSHQRTCWLATVAQAWTAPVLCLATMKTFNSVELPLAGSELVMLLPCRIGSKRLVA